MKIAADYLVLGSGIAGLFFALKAAQHGSVAVVTKRERRESNTQYAQGGIAAAMDAADSVASHAQDTLAAGAGLCDRMVVEGVVAEGPGVVDELLAIGAQFNEAQPEVLALGREGGHAHARVVHADDTTGREVTRALVAAVQALPQVTLYDHHLAVDLIVDDQRRCHGLGYWTQPRPSPPWLRLRCWLRVVAGRSFCIRPIRAWLPAMGSPWLGEPGRG